VLKVDVLEEIDIVDPLSPRVSFRSVHSSISVHAQRWLTRHDLCVAFELRHSSFKIDDRARTIQILVDSNTAIE
jgi:hypothetical protein